MNSIPTDIGQRWFLMLVTKNHLTQTKIVPHKTVGGGECEAPYTCLLVPQGMCTSQPKILYFSDSPEGHFQQVPTMWIQCL